MKVIQNILAINFILCLARHWLSNLRHQGTRCIGGEKIKVGGGGVAIFHLLNFSG